MMRKLLIQTVSSVNCVQFGFPHCHKAPLDQNFKKFFESIDRDIPVVKLPVMVGANRYDIRG